jgi:hypothetical protein
MPWLYDDGGQDQSHGPEFDALRRRVWDEVDEEPSLATDKYGHWHLGGCVCRAITIVTQRPYPEIWRKLHEFRAYPDFGVKDEVLYPFLKHLGFRQHHRCGWRQLPKTGRLLVLIPCHALAVIDGVVRDTFDSWRYDIIQSYWTLEVA